MNAELLRERSEPGAGGAAIADPAAPIASAFRPYMLGPRRDDAPGPGATHAAWTMAIMLRPPALDVLALAERPARALAIGGAEGWLGAQLLEWGFAGLLSVEPDERRRAALHGWRAALAFEPGRWTVEPELPSADDRPDRAGFDLALLDARLPGQGEAAPIADCAARTDGPVLIISADPASSAEAAREAGLTPLPVPAPADAEARFVRGELAILSLAATDER